jgi:hypothetical protein
MPPSMKALGAPAAIRPRSSASSTSWLDGSPGTWSDQLASIATDLGFSTLIVAVPDEEPLSFVRRLGEDVAPRLRELLG